MKAQNKIREKTAGFIRLYR